MLSIMSSFSTKIFSSTRNLSSMPWSLLFICYSCSLLTKHKNSTLSSSQSLLNNSKITILTMYFSLTTLSNKETIVKYFLWKTRIPFPNILAFSWTEFWKQFVLKLPRVQRRLTHIYLWQKPWIYSSLAQCSSCVILSTATMNLWKRSKSTGFLEKIRLSFKKELIPGSTLTLSKIFEEL